MMDFTDIVFSWSLEDIFNEDLYKNKVERIPESFESVHQYHGSYLYPLLEETRAQVHSSMETIDSAPFAQVVEFKKSKRQYKIKVDDWRNRFSDGGKEPYKTLPWDLFVLANAKPETVSDLELAGRSWSFVSVTHLSQVVSNVSKYDGDEDEDEDEDEKAEDTCLHFEVVSSKEFEVDESTSLFVVFLLNLIPNARIWKALHMSRNLDIMEQVLCSDSVGRENVCSEKNKDIMDKYRLNDSQTRAVLACLGMLNRGAKSAVELIWGPPGTGKTKTIATLLFTLLRMNCRALICAPTNVAITEVASHILKMVTEAESNALFCSLGKILLFGNKERLKLKKRLKLKVGSDIEEIYLDHRIQRLVQCLGPQTGWMHCFASMIKLLEDCVRDYNIFLANEWTKEKEQNSVCEMKDECRSGPEVSKDKCKTFLEYFRDRFVSTALPLRHCISVFCTHMTKRCISKHIFEDMVSLIRLVDSFEKLLLQGNVKSEAMEKLFSCSEVGDVSESYVDDSIPLFMKRRECLLALRTLHYSLCKVQHPAFRNENALMELCFQSASLIFCTASSSFKLHTMQMEPFSIVVIDEAAQMKECESTIPLQLPGVKHVALFGDERQLPAMVQSNVSQEAGFARSLFERLSSIGHPKHLLFMQYRMHPSISSFPNSSFYDNRIQDAPNVRIQSYKKHYLPGAMFGPYSFVNVNDGREEKDEDGHSRKNMVEVAIVLKLLRNLYKEWINSKQKLSVGVVSPYAAQVAAIQVKLGHKYDNLDGFKVKVKTIDGFQGGEEDIIIMSTVRTNSHQSLHFISNSQRVNVALTRARHCLWILGNERTLCSSGSVWKSLVLDAKRRQCFFNADQDKDLAKTIVDVKKELDQFNDLLNANSVLFKNARWKVLFSDNFLKSFKKLKSARLKKSVLNLLLKLSSGWRPKHNAGTSCSSSSLSLKKFKVEGLYIVCTTDIAKDLLEKENLEDLRYIQILKVWDILPLENIPKLVSRLETILNRYTDDFINLCNEKYLEGDLEVPQSWPVSMGFTETQSDFVGDTSDGSSYVENSQLYRENNYEMAAMCFERAGDTYWEQRSKAAGLKSIADRMRMSNPEEANSNLREAAEIFVAIGKADSAARCFSDSGEYERAARIYLEKCGDSELERAAECFTLVAATSSNSSHNNSSNPSHNTSSFIKLTETNYLVWLRQIQPYLKGNNLWGYIDGSKTEPAPTIMSTATETQPAAPVPNPNYAQWYQQDQIIISILTTTLTENVAQLTIGFDTSKDIWDCLARHFSQRSVASAASLKMQLLELNKGTQSVDEYLRHAKSIDDSLSSINKPVPDEELVLATLHGLGPDFLMLRTAITQNPPLPDFTELRARILSFEASQSTLSCSSEPNPATALYHASAPPRGRDNRHQPGWSQPKSGRHLHGRSYAPHGRYYQQQHVSQTPFPVQQPHAQNFGPYTSSPWSARAPSSTGLLGPAPNWCPNCHTNQHGLHQCPHRFSGPSTAAPFAGAHFAADPTWYPDTGATHHMTSMPLNNPQVYNGPHNVYMGNGDTMPISHTGPL